METTLAYRIGQHGSFALGEEGSPIQAKVQPRGDGF